MRDDGNHNTEQEEGEINKRTTQGKGAFIYRDKFSRTGWLNLMKPRLVLAQKLLSNNGVIFVSIDDTEQAYLKVLMDEIFGEENFICNFIWKNAGYRGDAKYVGTITEYILFYKSQGDPNIKMKEVNLSKYNESDSEGKYYSSLLHHGGLTYSLGMDYELIIDGKKYYAGNVTEKQWMQRRAKVRKSGERDFRWRWGEKTSIEKSDSLFIKNGKPYTKNYLKEAKAGPFANLIDSIQTSQGTKQNKAIFGGERTFGFPKPVELMEFLLNLYNSKSAIILDFFAGSGSTGHAVMELNRKDGGNRKFILSTNNENDIAINITYERLFRIMSGETTKKMADFEWVKKNVPYKEENLKVFEIQKKSIDFNTSLGTLGAHSLENLTILNDGKKINKENIYQQLTTLRGKK